MKHVLVKWVHLVWTYLEYEVCVERHEYSGNRGGNE